MVTHAIWLKRLLGNLISLQHDSHDIVINNGFLYYQDSELLLKFRLPENMGLPSGTYDALSLYNVLKNFPDDVLSCTAETNYIHLFDEDLKIELGVHKDTSKISYELFNAPIEHFHKLSSSFFQMLRILHTSLGNSFARGLTENLWWEGPYVCGYNGSVLATWNSGDFKLDGFVFPRSLIKKLAPIFLSDVGGLSICKDTIMYSEPSEGRTLIFPKIRGAAISRKNIIDAELSHVSWYPSPTVFSRVSTLLSTLHGMPAEKVRLQLDNHIFSVTSEEGSSNPFKLQQRIQATGAFSGLIDRQSLKDLSPRLHYSQMGFHGNMLLFRNSTLEFIFSLS